MKNIALFITALCLATVGIAGTTSDAKTQRAISDAWKANAVSGVSLDHNINVVGSDVAPRHDLAPATNLA